MKRYLFYLFFLNILLIYSCAPLQELSRTQVVQGPEFVPYTGIKKNIAILSFENRTIHGGEKFGSAVSDMLISLLMRSGRFQVIERQQLQTILQEQAIGQSGALTEETAAAAGKLLGVQAFIMGEIVDAEQKTGSHEFKSDDEEKDTAEKPWALALKATVGHVKLSYRLVDTNTGEILFANQATGTEIRPGFGIKTKEWDFEDMFDIDQTVMGYALRKAVNKMVKDIVNNAPIIEWSGKIIKVNDDNTVYFKPGRSSGMKVGDFFNIYQQNIINEEENLNELVRIGRVKVVDFVGEMVSKALILEGNDIREGHIVKNNESDDR